MQSIVPWRQNRAKCSYRPLQRAIMFTPPASTGKMFIPPTPTAKMFIPHETWLPAANYALARNATFSTNLDTKRRVYLERHGSDVTRVNTTLAKLVRVHFALVTIATMPPLVHNLLFLYFARPWFVTIASHHLASQPSFVKYLVQDLKLGIVFGRMLIIKKSSPE